MQLVVLTLTLLLLCGVFAAVLFFSLCFGTTVEEGAPCWSQDRRVAHQLPQKTQYSPVQSSPGLCITIQSPHPLLSVAPTAIYCFTFYDKCTYCKLLWIKASAECHKCKCEWSKSARGGISAAAVTVDCFGLTTDSMKAERAELITIILNVAETRQHIFRCIQCIWSVDERLEHERKRRRNALLTTALRKKSLFNLLWR